MTWTRSRRAVDQVLEWCLAALMAFMVVLVLWQVFTRFVLGAPASGTEELVRFALLWLSVLGAAYGFGKHAHLAIDLVPGWASERARWIRTLVVNAAIALFAALVLVAGGSRLVQLTLELGQTSASLAIERGYINLILPVSGFLVLFFVVSDTVDAWSRRRE